MARCVPFLTWSDNWIDYLDCNEYPNEFTKYYPLNHWSMINEVVVDQMQLPDFDHRLAIRISFTL